MYGLEVLILRYNFDIKYITAGELAALGISAQDSNVKGRDDS
jgi:hypothetical protein